MGGVKRGGRSRRPLSVAGFENRNLRHWVRRPSGPPEPGFPIGHRLSRPPVAPAYLARLCRPALEIAGFTARAACRRKSRGKGLGSRSTREQLARQGGRATASADRRVGGLPRKPGWRGSAGKEYPYSVASRARGVRGYCVGCKRRKRATVRRRVVGSSGARKRGFLGKAREWDAYATRPGRLTKTRARVRRAGPKAGRPGVQARPGISRRRIGSYARPGSTR